MTLPRPSDTPDPDALREILSKAEGYADRVVAHPYGSRFDAIADAFGEHGKVIEHVTEKDERGDGWHHMEGYTLYEDGFRMPFMLTERGWEDD